MRVEVPGPLESTPEATDVEVALTLVEEALRRETEAEEPLVQEMARHVVFAGGKRLRPRIALIAYRACGGQVLDHVIDAAAAFELIHAASLVHDDIIDDADIRRGRWSLHAKYSVDQAIVVGDFLFTRGFFLAGRLDERVVNLTAEACTRLSEGEVQEQRWAGQSDLPLEDYLTIIRKKTAEPIRACAATGAYLAGESDKVVDALGRYGLALGMAFQIQDDLLDLKGDSGKTGKPTGLDLDQGVLTLPFLIHRDEGGRLPRWRRIKALQRALSETNALQRAEGVAREYAEQAKSHLAALPDSPFKAMLTSLADAAVAREH